MKPKIQKIFILFFLSLQILLLNIILPDNELSNNPQNNDTQKKSQNESLFFRIGFLQTDSGQELGFDWYENIRRNLESDKDVDVALESEGFSGIVILPADGWRDMVQRMDHNEFDMAFCSAEIYVEQQGDYEPVLQLRRSRDIWGRGKVLQKGVIWVNYKSPLFSKNNPSNEEIKKYIESQPMAFVSSHSAPGYIYPRLKLFRDYSIIQPSNFTFCGSSEEVVKYLVNGLVEVGACENGVVEEVLKKNGIENYQDQLLKKLFETELLPTDPVCILKKWTPEKNKLGRVLANTLKKIHSLAPANVPRLETSYSDFYKNLYEEMGAFKSLRVSSKVK